MNKKILKILLPLMFALSLYSQSYSQEIKLSKELDTKIKKYIEEMYVNKEKGYYEEALKCSYKKAGFTEKHYKIFELRNNISLSEKNLSLDDFILYELEDNTYVEGAMISDSIINVSYPIIYNETFLGSETKEIILNQTKVFPIGSRTVFPFSCDDTNLNKYIDEMTGYSVLLDEAYTELNTSGQVSMEEIKSYFHEYYKEVESNGFKYFQQYLLDLLNVKVSGELHDKLVAYVSQMNRHKMALSFQALVDHYKEKGFTEEVWRFYNIMSDLTVMFFWDSLDEFIYTELEGYEYCDEDRCSNIELMISYPVVENGTYVGSEYKTISFRGKEEEPEEKIEYPAEMREQYVDELIEYFSGFKLLIEKAFAERDENAFPFYSERQYKGILLAIYLLPLLDDELEEDE